MANPSSQAPTRPGPARNVDRRYRDPASRDAVEDERDPKAVATYSFALIRICPDPRRGEILNIGVIVFLRSGVDIRLLPSLAKVQALYGNLDLSLIFSLPEKMTELLPKRGSIAHRHELVRRVGIVELSDLGQFSAIRKDEYESVVQELLAKLVRPTPVPRVMEAAPSLGLQRQVRKIIKEANLLGRKLEDLENHKVVTRYPLGQTKGCLLTSLREILSIISLRL